MTKNNVFWLTLGKHLPWKNQKVCYKKQLFHSVGESTIMYKISILYMPNSHTLGASLTPADWELDGMPAYAHWPNSHAWLKNVRFQISEDFRCLQTFFQRFLDKLCLFYRWKTRHSQRKNIPTKVGRYSIRMQLNVHFPAHMGCS